MVATGTVAIMIVTVVAVAMVRVEMQTEDARSGPLTMVVVVDTQPRPERTGPTRHAQGEHADHGEDGGSGLGHGEKYYGLGGRIANPRWKGNAPAPQICL